MRAVTLNSKMKIPNSIIKFGEIPEWEGEISGASVKVFFDPELSGYANEKQLAVFSELGFHGWLNTDFSLLELTYVATSLPVDYDKSLEEIKLENFQD